MNSVLAWEASLAFFSARFSLMDLPDFFAIVWRGDLSDMVDSVIGAQAAPLLLTLRCSAPHPEGPARPAAGSDVGTGGDVLAARPRPRRPGGRAA